MIEMEYDVSHDCILVKNGRATTYLMDESGHVCLLLLSYMGIDATMEGKRRYRHTSSESILHGDLPSVGETIRGVLEITSFINSGDTMLVLFTYKCFCGERQVSTVKAVGGFFTDEELRNSKGLVYKSEITNSIVENGNNHPYIACKKFSFDEEVLKQLYDAALMSQLNEGIISSFDSPEYCLKYLQQASCHPSLRMVDRITEINPHGGRWRLGEIWGEKLIADDHWAFKAHFKNDPIFPGCILTEGLNQLLSFLVVSLGVHVKYPDKEIGATLDLSTKSIFRGQVEKRSSHLKYHINVKEIEYGNKFKMIVDAEIYCDDKYIAHSENIGLESK
jgi:3-hydroxymyristoyl/3-hydroxydecanoyl-(acyl carrier protein) dehydratase